MFWLLLSGVWKSKKNVVVKEVFRRLSATNVQKFGVKEKSTKKRVTVRR